MSNDRVRIDWQAAKKQLQDAEAALEKALVADDTQIDRVFRDRAIQLAKRSSGGVANVRTLRVLVFSLGSERYGIELSDLAEVLPATICTPAPRAAAEIAGVINLRGELRSVIDLRRLLSIPPVADEPGFCILMFRNGREEAGLRVGRVEKVQTIREDELAIPDGGSADKPGNYVRGLSPDKVIVINSAALRSHPVFGNPR